MFVYKKKIPNTNGVGELVVEITVSDNQTGYMEVVTDN